jgi:hypothetical protein
MQHYCRMRIVFLNVVWFNPSILDMVLNTDLAYKVY